MHGKYESFSLQKFILKKEEDAKERIRNVTIRQQIGLEEPADVVRPCSKNGSRKITQYSIEVDAETKESMRKTEGKQDGRYKEGHERKEPK